MTRRVNITQSIIFYYFLESLIYNAPTNHEVKTYFKGKNMKKIILPGLLSILSATAMANGPMSQMEGYEATNISSDELSVSEIWDSMRTDVKGKDCYRRAQVWAYEMYKQYDIKSKKIFIHYTNKFNRELDELGRKGGMSFFEQKFFDVDGVSRRNRNMVRSNITWDYHVAPMITVDGEDVVLDRYLDLAYDAQYPYTEDEAWTMKARPASVEEWVEALTVRGELLWQVRKAELLDEIKEYTKKAKKYAKRGKAKTAKKYYDKADRRRATMDKLGMDQDSIDIKCEKVESIAEVDAAQSDAWCFYSEAPMYYYNEIDLRNLAYGNLGFNYAMPVDPKYATEENFEAGRQYVQTKFNKSELEDAIKELKGTNSTHDANLRTSRRSGR